MHSTHPHKRHEAKYIKSNQMFLSQRFLNDAPKFWDIDFNVTPISDHLAKFRGDRPAGSLEISRCKVAERKQKASGVKHKDLRSELTRRAAFVNTETNNVS